MFRNDNGVLKCRLHGENLWFLPWGKNALRVVARPMTDPELPAGAVWTDIRTGETFEGGKTVTCAAPIESIPVFLKNNTHPEWIGKL